MIIENKSEEQALSIYLVATLWANRANQVEHGKCYGCGNYVIHFEDCKRMNLFRGIR